MRSCMQQLPPASSPPPAPGIHLLQDGSAVAMTETVQGTYRIDLSSLQTLGRVRGQSQDARRRRWLAGGAC